MITEINPSETTPESWNRSLIEIPYQRQISFCKVLANGKGIFGYFESRNNKVLNLSIPLKIYFDPLFWNGPSLDGSAEKFFAQTNAFLAAKNSLVLGTTFDLIKAYRELGTNFSREDLNLVNGCETSKGITLVVRPQSEPKTFEDFVKAIQSGRSWQITPITISELKNLQNIK